MSPVLSNVATLSVIHCA